MRTRGPGWAMFLAAGASALGVVGCGPAADRAPGKWSVSPGQAVEGLDAPECVAVDAASGAAFVSNIETSDQGYWVDDGKGFVSRLTPEGRMAALRWADSTKDLPLNAPKGMCVLNGSLYAADNTRVVRLPIAPAAPAARVIAVPGAERLNDMATSRGAVWVSDTAAGKVYRIDSQGKVNTIRAPAGVNGITFAKGSMFAVSWDLHDVYELDPTGLRDPKPFGLASHFKNLDGIEVLDDGTLVVSDFTGGKVCAIDPDRKTVRTLLGAETPADIGLDRQRGILYVPMLTKNRVGVYRLAERP